MIEVLTKETSDLVIGLLTDKIKPKVPFMLRPLVKPALGVGVGALNKMGGQCIPDSVDKYINEAIIRGHRGDWDNAAAAIGMAADELIDIPNIDDAHESNVFVTISQAIVQGVRVWIEKKRA